MHYTAEIGTAKRGHRVHLLNDQGRAVGQLWLDESETEQVNKLKNDLSLTIDLDLATSEET